MPDYQVKIPVTYCHKYVSLFLRQIPFKLKEWVIRCYGHRRAAKFNTCSFIGSRFHKQQVRHTRHSASERTRFEHFFSKIKPKIFSIKFDDNHLNLAVQLSSNNFTLSSFYFHTSAKKMYGWWFFISIKWQLCAKYVVSLLTYY